LKNYGVTIYLKGNVENDLINILNVIGESGKKLNWKISNLDCLGKNSEVLDEISEQNKEIEGTELYQLFSQIYQTIEGEFIAFENNSTQNLITIRAIDGSEFDVETNDLEILKNIRNTFENVKDLTY